MFVFKLKVTNYYCHLINFHRLPYNYVSLKILSFIAKYTTDENMTKYILKLFADRKASRR